VPDLRYSSFSGDEDEDEEEGDTAVQAACRYGQAAILERLGPEPARDDYDELYCSAANAEVVAILARSSLPTDSAKVVTTQLARADWTFGNHRPVETLHALFRAGVRWHASALDEIADVRRRLLRCSDCVFGELMKLLATADHCSREVLTELARTPRMRERMKKVGLIPATAQDRSAFDRARPARAREMLEKVGIEQPRPRAEKPVAYLRYTERIREWRDGRELRLDREVLFERVWAVPVEKLAKEWGLSGRGLAKACRRLHIPVPPRGYWARVAAGQRLRRPRLPSLPPGQAEEIVIYVPRPQPE
jgi:hypothetical protein